MSLSLRHFARKTKKKKATAEKAHRVSGRGFPQPPSLISFNAWSSDRRQKQTESNLEKMREWRSHGKKKRKKKTRGVRR